VTIRNDIEIEWYEDPRLAEITTTSDEVSVQDSHDTLTTLEDEPEGHQFEFLVSTAGKEDLGGGSFVGLTTTLNNVQYAPQRTGPRSTTTDTVTTGGTNGFICSAATFQTDNVARGDWVINWTDQSVSEVLTVVSETELTVRTPSGMGASSNDFAVSDVITVWEVSEFQLAGGNFVAVDSGALNINPLFTVFGRFATRTSSSSATLQELDDVQHSSYAGGVWLDSVNGVDGTVHPAGNEQNPVKTWASALSRATDKGFRRIFVLGDYTFGASDVLDGYEFVGESPNQTLLTFTAGCSTSLTEFISAELTGTLDGALSIINCHIEELIGVGGSLSETNIHNCLFEPAAVTMTLTAGATEKVNIIDCWSGSPGDTPITIDWNGTGPDGVVRSWDGGFKILNMSNGQEVSFDSSGAHLQVDATSTSGTVVYRGSTKFTDTGSSLTTTDQTTAALNWAYSAALTLQKWIGLR
jgi:hypothetical protein